MIVSWGGILLGLGQFVQDFLQRRTLQETVRLGQTVKAALRQSMMRTDSSLLDNILVDLRSTLDLRRVWIIDKNGRVAHSSRPSAVGEVLLKEQAPICISCHADAIDRGTKTLFARDESGTPVLRFMDSIANEEPCWRCHDSRSSANGYLLVEESTAEYEDALGSIRRHLGVTGGLTTLVLVGICGVMVFATTILLHRPVRHLLGGVQEMRAGDLAVRLPVRGRDELAELCGGFNGMAEEMDRRHTALVQSHESQRKLNALLRLSLEDLELDELLRQALEIALRKSWPAFSGVGAVFLIEGKARELVLKAHNGLSREILESCARVPVGHCLCGRVAASGQPLYSGGLDEQHEITYAGMQPHGHYCIPISAASTVLGVLNVYLQAGHPRSRSEEGFLCSFSDTLAGMIVRKHAQASIRLVEDQLLQAQKMEAIGRLAGGVAHDFNNLLTIIGGYAEMLRSDLPDDAPAQKDLQEIHAAAKRAAGLTRQLLSFSRKQVLQTRVLNLNEVVAEAVRLLRRLIGEDLQLITVGDPQLGAVRADSGQIEQVLMNLAVNARDAMPHGGRLTIETANVEVDDDYARQHQPMVPGRYVMLTVSDTGTGMNAEVLARLFEPFFTTKARGTGTGLGLATVYGIVKQSDGYIWVYSELGRGSSFKIYLPRVDEPIGAADAAAPETVNVAGHETVLIAEDDDSVLNLARTVLERRGFTVLAASSGEAALQVARDHPGPIELLLTDVVMPGMTGRQLAEELSLARPGLKVIYASGYTESTLATEDLARKGRRFLQKPFTPRSLERAVREILNEGSAATDLGASSGCVDGTRPGNCA